MEYFAQYLGFGILLLLTVAVISIPKSMGGRYKLIFLCYYFVLSTVFIIQRYRIDQKYDETPVPDRYWDANTEWVTTISNFYFIPLVAVLIFLFYKWFGKAEGKMKKGLITAGVLPVGFLVLIFLFLFNFTYGYRP